LRGIVTDIVEFLLARIAEDEQAARDGEAGCGHVGYCDFCDGAEALARFQERFTADRVLAECEAKRRIVDRHCRWQGPLANVYRDACYGCSTEGDMDTPRTDPIDECPELRDLAAIYDFHEDYDESWRPE
jgi:hypothetical protein